MKKITHQRYTASFVALVVAFFASVHIASATQVNVQLTGSGDPELISDGNYWNVIEFGGGGYPSISDALDINSASTGISVAPSGEEYDGGSGCVQETGGGSITFAITLPAGTFDITPGFGIGSTTATITGDSFTGIEGPTTVYLSFLNDGYAITTATSIVIDGDIDIPTTTQINVQLTGSGDPELISDGNYWNVIEFGGGGYPSISDALDINALSTGISVAPSGEEYDGGSGCVVESGGGSITFEIDLPSGTFDITPGFGIGSTTATITGDSFTGITGPTTVYLSFLNDGYAITTATSIVINQY